MRLIFDRDVSNTIKTLFSKVMQLLFGTSFLPLFASKILSVMYTMLWEKTAAVVYDESDNYKSI